MNISGIDLNLLRIFDAMMQERSTTKVAERVGLSQPAVSSALTRLRHLAKDELFIREGAKMVPTSKAVAMLAPVRTAMSEIENAFDVTAPFDAATATRQFRLLGSDYFSTLLMPPLAELVRRTAPGVVLQMLDMPTSVVVSSLSDGRVDLALAPSTIEPAGYIGRKTLFHSFIVSVVSRHESIFRDAGIMPGARIPPELFCAIPHVMMSMDGSMRGTIDDPLEKRGLARKVTLTLPHFHAVALAVASGGLVANLPVHYAQHVANELELDIYLPPFDAALIEVVLFWHRRHDSDSANRWLRDRVTEIFSLASLTQPMDQQLKAGIVEKQAAAG